MAIQMRPQSWERIIDTIRDCPYHFSFYLLISAPLKKTKPTNTTTTFLDSKGVLEVLTLWSVLTAVYQL